MNEVKPQVNSAATQNAAQVLEIDEVLFVGIDLGTSRSSIAASNGVRETVVSVVGYPKDEVSRKLLGKDVVYGEEALRKRLALHLYRPLEKGVIKHSDDPAANPEEARANLRAAQDLIRHIIAQARPLAGQKIYGVIGAPAQASIHNKRAIIDAAREMLDSVLITSEPFSVAYGLGRFDDALVVDIGAGTIDLCRMHGAFPDEDDQITISNAGDYIDKVLYGLLRKNHEEAQFTLNMVRRIKEEHAFVDESKEQIQVQLPVNGEPHVLDLTQEIKQACGTIVKPIVASIRSLVASFDPEFQEKLRQNIILAGGGSQIQGLGKLIQDELRSMS